MEIIAEDKYKDTTSYAIHGQDDSLRAALKNLKSFLLREDSKSKSDSDNCVANAISRIQCIDALQTIIDSANEKVLKPEESYSLKANYRDRCRVKKQNGGIK